MNGLKLKLPAFAALVIIQLAAPAWMIWQHEVTLREGKVFRFRTAPVDPYDAFRGRYVWLQLEQNSVPHRADQEFAVHQKVYAPLETDEQGFGRFTSVSAEPPDGHDYLTCRVSSVTDSLVYLDLPFNRFYMEESVAPQAEAAYQEHSRRNVQDAYVTVRIRNGKAVLEDLYLAGVPIREYVKRSQ